MYCIFDINDVYTPYKVRSLQNMCVSGGFMTTCRHVVVVVIL